MYVFITIIIDNFTITAVFIVTIFSDVITIIIYVFITIVIANFTIIAVIIVVIYLYTTSTFYRQDHYRYEYCSFFIP